MADSAVFLDCLGSTLIENRRPPRASDVRGRDRIVWLSAATVTVPGTRIPLRGYDAALGAPLWLSELLDALEDA